MVLVKEKCRKMDTENCNRSSREELVSSGSTAVDITENDVPAGDGDGAGSAQQLTTTSVLRYCKRRILRPYLRLLSLAGLRPLMADAREPSACAAALGAAHLVLVAVLLATGHLLQYMACFRRERGFCYRIAADAYLFGSEARATYERICHAPMAFSFLMPALLHTAGFASAAWLLRTADDDHLPILMERVFLSSTNLLNGYACQRTLVKKLWVFVAISILWMTISLSSVNFMMAEGTIYFRWMDNAPDETINFLKVLLVVATLLQDIIQATIISNYCLQAQLLTSHVQFLREKLLQYPVQPLEWMREIEEFKKILKYFNQDVSPSVCLITIVNVSYAVSGTLWLLKYDNVDRETTPIVGVSVLNVILWAIISIVPFIQAGRLSAACSVLKEAGQEVRIRPFAHQGTPVYELDSVLLYTTSLDVRARLFGLPITGTYVCAALALALVTVLVLGQCHYLIPNNA